MDAVSCSLSSLGDVFVMAAELCMCVDYSTWQNMEFECCMQVCENDSVYMVYSLS